VALREFKCVDCGESFKSGQWLGCRTIVTRRHTVQSRTFYSQFDNYHIVLRADYPIQEPGGKIMHVPALSAQFRGGTFITNDAEIQEFLDGGTERGELQTAEQYVDGRLTDKQKMQRKDSRIAEQSRLIQDLERKNVELAGGVTESGGGDAERSEGRRGRGRSAG